MFNFLQEKSYSLGFQLVRIKSLKVICISISCYIHGEKNKKLQLNTYCSFCINIAQIMYDNIKKYHVTKILN